MKKYFKRFGAFLLVCIMCMSMTSVAFAAESEPTPYAIGKVEYADSRTLTSSSITFSIYTNEGNWDADFLLSVGGAPSETFSVTMMAANGTIYQGTVSGNGAACHFNMAYAKAGEYRFTFTRSNGSTTSVMCLAQICD